MWRRTARRVNFTPEAVARYKQLVAEARALFGATHYRHYDFLYVLTDQIMPDGLEHHESSDNRSPYRTFLDDDLRRAEAALLAHEYTHSWNGKFRRPVGLATRNYQDPMRGELLWVYEGLTEYLGNVLAVRSGLFTNEEFQGELAHDLAGMQTHSGRTSRNLQDTTIAAQLLYVQPRDWAARLRRQEDFYQESALDWLEADTLIRKLSGGRRSLDDFCCALPRRRRRQPARCGRTISRRCCARSPPCSLTTAQLDERIRRARAEVPSAGLVKLAGARAECRARSHAPRPRGGRSRASICASRSVHVNDDATLADIIPGSPADAAGLASLERLIAVNGRKSSKDELRDALAATSRGSTTVTLLLEKDDVYRSVDLHYAGGPREPRLVRIEGSADLLTLIARPRAPAAR